MVSFSQAISDAFSAIFQSFASILQTIISAFQSLISLINTLIKDVTNLSTGLVQFLMSRLVIIGAHEETDLVSGNIFIISFLTVAFFMYAVYRQRQGRPIVQEKKKNLE
jgi:hypothetical protein